MKSNNGKVHKYLLRGDGHVGEDDQRLLPRSTTRSAEQRLQQENVGDHGLAGAGRRTVHQIAQAGEDKGRLGERLRLPGKEAGDALAGVPGDHLGGQRAPGGGGESRRVVGVIRMIRKEVVVVMELGMELGLRTVSLVVVVVALHLLKHLHLATVIFGLISRNDAILRGTPRF